MDWFTTQVIPIVKLVMISMVPFILAAQGTMLAGRTGIFNVSQEGVMLVGASVGFLAGLLSGNLFIGILSAMIVGAMFGLLLAYFTTSLRMNQFVTGLALYFSGIGISTLLPKVLIGVSLSQPIIPT